jgi:hypothetical protein
MRRGGRSGALGRLVQHLEETIGEGKLTVYEPPEAQISALARRIGADTICLCRVYARRFSSFKKATGVLGLEWTGIYAGADANTFGNTDALEALCVFIDVETAEVLWQRAAFLADDPEEPSEDFMEDVLEYLPKRGEPQRGRWTRTGLVDCSG